MWQRRCPQCKRLLEKYHLNDVLICVCKWVWGKGEA